MIDRSSSDYYGHDSAPFGITMPAATLVLWNASDSNYVSEYGYNESQKYLQKYLGPRHSTLTEALALTTVYCTIFLTGIFGNVCTGLVVLSRSYMRTSTNLYLCSLAISDIFTLLLGLPTELYTVWEAYPWRFGQPYCLFKTFLTEMTSSASILTIAAFTVERHVAICYPLLAHTMSMSRLSRTAKVVAGVWLVAALTALPYPLYTRTYYYLQDPASGRPLSESLICNIPAKWVPQMRRIFQLSTFSMFVLPMTLITVLYVHIGVTVRRSVTRSPEQGSISASAVASPPSSAQATPKRPLTPGRRSTRKSVTNMLVAVVVAFFVCWAPFHAQRLMTVYVNEDQWTKRLIELQSLLFYVSGILYFVSCTVNPILYNLLSHRYRRAFADVLCSGCGSSSAFARWRRISFARWQSSFASHSPEGRRGRTEKQQDGVLLNGGDRRRSVVLEAAGPRRRCYGSVRSVDVELGAIELDLNKSRIIEVRKTKRKEMDVKGVLVRGINDQGVFGRSLMRQGLVAAGSTEPRATDAGSIGQGQMHREVVRRTAIRRESFQTGRPTDPLGGTIELPETDIFEAGTEIFKPETSVNTIRLGTTPDDDRICEISQKSCCGEISPESRNSENCSLVVRRVVQKVTLTGDAVTKYESFLLSHADQGNDQWRQVKRGHRGKEVTGSKNRI